MKPGEQQHHHHHADFIVRDAEAQANKRTLMNRLKSNSILNSVSKVAAFVAGPLVAYGLIEAAKIAGPAFAAASGITGGIAAAGAAVAASPIALAAVGVLAVGAAFAAVAVVSDYVASRKWQSSNIDTQEATAQSTGRHIAQELKKEGLCITTSKDSVECEANQRRDGKSWVQATREQQQQQATR